VLLLVPNESAKNQAPKDNCRSGFKTPKWITAMFVTSRFPGGFCEDRGYNWFVGV